MSLSGPAVTHFEVYTLDDQRWILHARYRGDEREASVVEAKLIERSLNIAAKVVREVYYPGNNTAEETVIYISDKSMRDASSSANRLSAVARGRAHARPSEAEAAAAAAAAANQTVVRAAATRSVGVLLKLTIVIAAALVASSAVTGIVSAFAERLPQYGIHLSDEAMSLTLFTTFVITFLSVGVPLAMSLINWQGAGRSAPKHAAPPRPLYPVRPVVAPKPKPEKKVAEEELEELEEDEEEEEEIPLPGVDEEPIAPVADLPKAEEPKPEEPAAEAEKDKEKEAAAADDGMEGFRMTLMRFLSSLLGTVKKARPQLDAYNKFGVDLMLAGAVEVMGNEHHLDITDKRLLLRNVIEVMGTKPETAKAFADRFEDYLVEPRYMTMVQMGRSAMEGFAAGSDTAADQFAAVVDTWNKPQTPQAQARIVTVLFTDMVGSTDLTQARGDSAAQDIVRRHNTIVRAALAEYSGKEIKHTGDGIMASFASPANGVEAAIAIQKAVAAQNVKHRDLGLRLRIGMNAGEPIEEEDDLFGSTVQLAARVCAQSATDQILCTNVVRELSAGKGLVFVSQGNHELKGFKDKVPLYEVVWDSKAQAAQATASAAGGTEKKKA